MSFISKQSLVFLGMFENENEELNTGRDKNIFLETLIKTYLEIGNGLISKKWLVGGSRSINKPWTYSLLFLLFVKLKIIFCAHKYLLSKYCCCLKFWVANQRVPSPNFKGFTMSYLAINEFLWILQKSHKEVFFTINIMILFVNYFLKDTTCHYY